MLSWGVGQDRNNWVFEKVRKSPENLLAEALGFIEAFDSIHGPDPSLGFLSVRNGSAAFHIYIYIINKVVCAQFIV